MNVHAARGVSRACRRAQRQAPLRLKLLHWPGYVLTMPAMNAARASFYFWYYFPKPLAEEGLRSP